MELDDVTYNEIEQGSRDNSIKSENNLEYGNSQELLKKTYDIQLNKRESVFFASALEDSLMELLILRSCNKKIEMIIKKDVCNINTKFGNMTAKMNSDRELIAIVIIKLFLDLKFNHKYVTLNMQLADIAGKSYQSIAQELRYNENRLRLKKLRRHYSKEMQINKSLLFNCDLQIYKLRDEIDNDVWNCEAKQYYIDAHQCAKIEEHFMKVKLIENDCNGSIACIKNKIDDEIRINIEIENFTRQTMKEIFDEISEWKEKYEKESTKLSNETLELEGMREIQAQKVAALQKTVEEHLAEMEAWKAVVAERERRLQHEHLLQTSAVTLQAWWRGLLVRRRLAAKRAKDTKRKSAKKIK